MNNNHSGCLICHAPLEYLTTGLEMECSICKKRELSLARCQNGHFICDNCHQGGFDRALAVCRQNKSPDPVALLNRLMALDGFHLHGPEHHTLIGLTLLSAFRAAGGKLPPDAVSELCSRAQNIPGGACGFWGACGAALGCGIFLSVITGATPLSSEAFGLANRLTGQALSIIGKTGGPRCCKRNSYLSLTEAVHFVRENLGISMTLPARITCGYSAQNRECLQEHCPFYPEKSQPR